MADLNTLTLSAWDANDKEIDGPVEASSSVTLRVAADPDETLPEPAKVIVTNGTTSQTPTAVPGKKYHVLEVAPTAETQYQAQIIGGDAAANSAHLTIQVKKTTGEAEDDENKKEVTETEIGEYDEAFSFTAAVISGLVLVLVSVGAIFVFIKFVIDTPTEANAGTFVPRLQSAIILATGFTGAIAVIAAIFMAALETRGRLRTVTTTTAKPLPDRTHNRAGITVNPVEKVGQVVKQVLEITAEVAKVMRSARATIAAFIFGTVLLVTAVLLAAYTVDAPTVKPVKNTSTSTSSTTPPPTN